MKTLIIIPSRMSATRLPGKPLLKINGLSIISHVFKKAESANIGDVIVATEDQEILEDVKKNGGNAILTSKNHKTGTDRIYEAFRIINRKDVDFVMNIQGDEPDIEIDDIKILDTKMKSNKSKIGTMAAEILNRKIYENENVVKVRIDESFKKNSFPYAKNFMRKTNDKIDVFHHMGIYSYQVETLKKFISLAQSKNELNNRLEQLRAIDNDIKINVALANKSPIGVDTKEDYLAIKNIMKYK
ncbi:3-deoxy-manno-octulosonate cytidylyltransferase [Candidatus Pelagibacter communis]|uniref:3-deoxy-manno-octulosonate cytidylyltransferase n=1 Tax=Pelagibacter ubique TaxID=198252 RepID=UPI00094DA30D|nr:3-deoxy-manno-octulosonate cytidylyltransferase [Candidatus Pelagibacter ubique]